MSLLPSSSAVASAPGGPSASPHTHKHQQQTQHVTLASILHKYLPHTIAHALHRFLKGFLCFYGLNVVIDMLKNLFQNRSLLKLLAALPTLMFRMRSIRYGCFLGGLTLCTSIIPRVLPSSVSPPARSLYSSLLCSMSVLFVPRDERAALAVFVAVRAMEASVKYILHYGEHQHANHHNNSHNTTITSSSINHDPPPSSQSALNQTNNNPFLLAIAHFLRRHSSSPFLVHFDSLLMASSCGVISYCWLLNRPLVHPSMLRLLDTQGAKDRVSFNAFLEVFDTPTLSSATRAALDDLYRRKGLPLLDYQHPNLQCHILHRDHPDSCHLAMLNFMSKALLRALPLYVPVYLLPLLFRQRQLRANPVGTLMRSGYNLIRSSVFMTLLCSLGWYSSCMQLHALGLKSKIRAATSGFMCGLSILVEQKSRRLELALYVLQQALPVAFKLLCHHGLLRPIEHAESVIFACGFTSLMCAYQFQRSTIRPTYLSVLDFLFANAAAPLDARHSTGNMEMVTPQLLETELASTLQST